MAKKNRRPKPDSTLSERKSQILALRNLEALDLSMDVNLDATHTFLAINNNGQSKLSVTTKNTLKSLGLDPLKMSHLQLVDRLNGVLANPNHNPPAPSPFNEADDSQGYIQSVGIANLLVVKQQILRYEAAEIAHIENVLAGEKKIRVHSQLTRSEEFFSNVNEVTTDSETELETTERFELNKQTSKTFQKDTELGLELTLSGKYGPTISFESNLNTGQTTSLQESNEQSINFAKDTIERSKERIIEKITVKQEKTLIKEIKEKNKHILENDDEKHRFAIYQYVDKIYKSQVFDYGIRQMFDFMVPEPSSYLWYLKNTTNRELDLQKPESLAEKEIYSPKDITKYNYQKLGAEYRVNDLPPPPPIFITKRLRLPAFGDGSSPEGGRVPSGVSGEITIPNGYNPTLSYNTILARSDDEDGDIKFSFNVGGNIFHYIEADMEVKGVDGNLKTYQILNDSKMLGTPISMNNLAPDEKLSVDVYGYESANYTIHMDIQFYANYNPSILDYYVVAQWKQGIYEKLAQAYETAMLEYEQDKSYLLAEARGRNDVDFGSPPAVNKKLILTELKKHCLAIVRNQHLGTLNTSHSDDEPPQFNLQDAQEDGETIRFLEHAFEWSQMQYVFYPYFWAEPGAEQEGWIDRFMEKNSDYTMEEFLKSGYARVVVPVREGFHNAVSYFILNGKPFYGLGEPPVKNPLYLSITKEIKERTGAEQGEIAVGEPWETRLPTAAIIVKDLDELPEWVRLGDDWQWEPK